MAASMESWFCLSFLIILCLLCGHLSCEEQCTKENKEDCESVDVEHEKSKYKNEKWTQYLEKVKKAVNNYEKSNSCPTPDNDCKCHQSQIDADFWVFESYKKKQIKKDMITATDGRGSYYQIIDHKLYREKKCMFPARCAGVEHFLLEIIDELPDMEFRLNDRDWPQVPRYSVQDDRLPNPVFSFSKDSNNHDIMYPAWTFWEGGPAISLYPTGIGRWDQHRISIPEENKKWPWEKKNDIVFFRGSRTSDERDPLVLMSRKHPDIVDAQYTKNQGWKSDKDTLGAKPAKEVSFDEHCKYRYLFNFRGVAASFRFKHLFLCNSTVFHVGGGSDAEVKEFFYEAMKPWVHYIPVRQDLSDAWDLIHFARENQELAQEIAERGRQFIMDHLRMEDVSCYWKKILLRYKKLLGFKPIRNPEFSERISTSGYY